MKSGLPDLTRAHGAWVYLAVSVAAGALWAPAEGTVRALSAGSGTLGGYLVLAAGVRYATERGGTERSEARRAHARDAMLRGAAVLVAGPLLALSLGADPRFLWLALTAVPFGLLALHRARTVAWHAPSTLLFASIALSSAAPVAAFAGGLSAVRSSLLVLALAPFFAWRSHAVVQRLPRLAGSGESMRDCGMREAGYAAAWSLALVAVGAG